jgi:hypothetical protein
MGEVAKGVDWNHHSDLFHVFGEEDHISARDVASRQKAHYVTAAVARESCNVNPETPSLRLPGYRR